MIERQEVLTLVPHGPGMCLIQRVLDWDESHIHCESTLPSDPAHPLRIQGRLAAVTLIELGAQAMAVHGALIARAGGARARPGMLVSARQFQTVLERLDDLPGAIEILARREMLRSDGMMHSFEARHGGESIASGRVAVLFEA